MLLQEEDDLCQRLEVFEQGHDIHLLLVSKPSKPYHNT
jgi:hypothetical protein